MFSRCVQSVGALLVCLYRCQQYMLAVLGVLPFGCCRFANTGEMLPLWEKATYS